MSEDYTITPARYAKDKVVLRVAPDGTGYKNRAARLICARGFGARWVNRYCGYVVSPAAAERFRRLYDAGWDACYATGALVAPEPVAADEPAPVAAPVDDADPFGEPEPTPAPVVEAPLAPPAPKPAAKPVTHAEFMRAASQYVQKHGMDAFRAKLAPFGVPNAAAMPEGDREMFLASLEG